MIPCETEINKRNHASRASTLCLSNKMYWINLWAFSSAYIYNKYKDFAIKMKNEEEKK